MRAAKARVRLTRAHRRLAALFRRGEGARRVSLPEKAVWHSIIAEQFLIRA